MPYVILRNSKQNEPCHVYVCMVNGKGNGNNSLQIDLDSVKENIKKS